MTTVTAWRGGVVATTTEIATSVAALAAAEVDRDARFPIETITALRSAGVLGAMVPEAWGGPGASLGEVATSVAALASHCSSSGLVLAMHHIQAATLARHGSEAMRDVVLPAVVSGQLLLANASSEVGLGGSGRVSLCALEPFAGGFRLEKHAATISYGEYADAILATARRSPDAPDNDQVLAVCMAPGLRYEATGKWDTLGVRGTCSRPGVLRATLPADLVVWDYADAFARTMLPVANVLLSAVWLGLAEGAARQAHSYLRARARKDRNAPDSGPPLGTVRLAELGVTLQTMRDAVYAAAADYEAVKDTDEVATLGFTGRMDRVKITTSTLVTDVVVRAMTITGLAGYANQSPHSLGRVLRDSMAAPLMVNNDRLLQATAQALLIRKSL